jgi:dihydrofolate synthase/folylpolyglutamate synthase
MFRIRPRLDHIRKVLHALGDPQNSYPVILIAGTNGKGSVAASLESVLRASGYRTGLYTSPHLTDIRERISLGGIPFHRGMARIASQVLEAEKRTGCSLTYFEYLTAIAFQSFAARTVQIAVIECGLGGQWDATNVVKKPLLSIITNVGLDHTEWLGKTESQIAVQKAGVIRNHGCVISGVRGTPRRAILVAARRKHSELLQIDTDFRAESLTVSWRALKQTISFLYKHQPSEIVPFGLLGSHQIDNAAIVMAAVKKLIEKGYAIPEELRDLGLLQVNWPGRLQIIRSNRAATLLLDGAHNPPAMKMLLDSIEAPVFQDVPKTFIFSAFKDKDISTMGRMISRVAAEVCLCPLPGSRAASLSQLRSAFTDVKGPVREFRYPLQALKAALHDTPKEGLVIVTGSLAFVGQMLIHKPSLRANVSLHV